MKFIHEPNRIYSTDENGRVIAEMRLRIDHVQTRNMGDGTWVGRISDNCNQ